MQNSDRYGKDKKNRENVVRKNYDVRSPTVRIVTDNIGVVSNAQAQKIAQERGLDLVEISFNKIGKCDSISVCKLCDYSKFVYERKQREKEARKTAKANEVEIKKMQLHITSDTGDVDRKVRQCECFLGDGKKVRLEIFLRGREMNMKVMASDLMSTVLNRLATCGVQEYPPKWEGRSYSVMIRPNRRN